MGYRRADSRLRPAHVADRRAGDADPGGKGRNRAAERARVLPGEADGRRRRRRDRRRNGARDAWDGRRRQSSVPQGFVAPGMAEWLHGQARRTLPPVFVRLVEATTEPFVQTIHDLAVPRMAFRRVCLTGDAAFVPRPHTAASTAKAATNALALADCLTVAKGDVIDSLRRWEPEQLELGRQLQVHGQRLGNRSQFDR